MSKHEMKMYQSTEDYLEAILMIKQEKGHCRSVDIAKRLDFKKSSVSIAVTKLTNEGYVIKEEAYDDACRMEHAMCDDTFHKIVSYVREKNDGNS